jgi:two-component system CheB/CheR fusion protein
MAVKVLVVEDNRDAADSLRDLLEYDGYEVALAFDGAEGLARAREFKPDVTLCDIGLPEMDGYSVARAFRQDASLASSYLVALTGYTQPEAERMVREAGFDAFVAKPPDPEALALLLANLRPR